jgi:hypothetical protein
MKQENVVGQTNNEGIRKPHFANHPDRVLFVPL